MKITIPVTPELRSVLVTTEDFLSSVVTSTGADKPRRGGKDLNDRSDFAGVLDLLEGLVRTLLVAQSHVPLGKPVPAGARIVFTSDDSLNAELFRTVDYLNDAGAQGAALGANGRSQFKAANTIEALARLKALNDLILSSILVTAKADLYALSGFGVSTLLDTADTLAVFVQEGSTAPAKAVATEVDFPSETFADIETDEEWNRSI